MKTTTRTLTAASVAALLATGLLAGSASAAPTDPATPTATESSAPQATAQLKDNAPGSAFHAPVQWMVDNGITAGYADGTFKKLRHVTRGETSAFLYRYIRPDHTPPATSPFKDINVGGANYAPISWMAGSETNPVISAGYSDRTYRPSRDVTRGEFAAFLYRIDSPAFSGPWQSPFKDLQPGDPNYQAITWLAAEGVTVGDTKGNFNPHDQITRGEMAAFLQRYDIGSAGK